MLGNFGRMALLCVCAVLAGCVGRPEAARVGDESVRLLVIESGERLRALVAGLSVPAGPEALAEAQGAAQAAAVSLDAARLGLVHRAAVRIAEPGIVSGAELAIIGVTLTVCREAVRKAAARMERDWAAAGRLAQGELTYACVLPLAGIGGY